MKRALLCITTLAALLLVASPASAQDAGAGGGDAITSSCSEYLPEGATRPKLESKLPSRSLSGYAVELLVTVTHGPGETVMPDGFKIQRGSDAMLALREAGWVMPEPDGGAAPLIDRPDSEAGGTTTNVTIPFVPLPEEPGRHVLKLPPLPISVARSNGQVMTLCTSWHKITIEDPIANEVDPQVKRNASPRPQREEWTAAKNFVIGALIVLVLAVLLAWLLRKYQQRPRVEPPKPKVLPWLAAMAALDEIRRSRMLADEHYDAYFDRVDDITRTYLGDRYGFDGLESTSEEIRDALKRVYPPIGDKTTIDKFLAEGDFVKYAEVTPRLEDCQEAMSRARKIVAVTTPEEEALKKARKRKKKKKRNKRKRKGKAA